MNYSTIDEIEPCYLVNAEQAFDYVRESIKKLFDEIEDWYVLESDYKFFGVKNYKFITIKIDNLLEERIRPYRSKLLSPLIWPAFFNPMRQIEFVDFSDSDCYQIEADFDNGEEDKDAINPDHYKNQTSLECIEAMEIIFGRDAVIDFCTCNAWKYIWRWKNKNGKEDLEKAKWYLGRSHDMMSGDDPRYRTLMGMIRYTNDHMEGKDG